MDLKLKICRGTSVKNILVREAESYSASRLIVGTTRSHHTIRSSTSVAKYCAKKLPKECGVLAVNNGKIVFKREGSPGKTGDPKGLVNSILRYLVSSLSFREWVFRKSQFSKTCLQE